MTTPTAPGPLEVEARPLAGEDGLVLAAGPSFGAVQVRLVIEGGADVDGDVPGAANVAVAMMERGTTSLDREAFHEALELVGAQAHGSVRRDATVFSMRCLEEALPRAMELFTQMLTAPADDADELADAIDEIDDDAMLQLESPDGAVSRVLPAVLWPGQPWSMPIDGTRGSRRRIDRRGLRAARRALMSRRAWIGVASDDPGRHEDTVRALREALRDAWGVSDRRPSASPEARPEGHALAKVDDEAQAELVLAGPAPGVDDASWDAVVMHHAVWSAGFGSPLVRTVRSEHGLSYDVQSTLHGARGASVEVIRMAPSPEQAPLAAELTLGAWRELAEEGVGEAALERARALLLGEHAASLDTVRRRLQAAMELARTGRPLSELWLQPARLLALDAAGVSEAASRYGLGTGGWCFVSSSATGDVAPWGAVSGGRAVRTLVPEDLA